MFHYKPNNKVNTGIVISTVPIQYEITYDNGNGSFMVGVLQGEYNDDTETFDSVDEIIDYFKEYAYVKDFWCIASLITWKGNLQGNNANSSMIEYKYFNSINDSELKKFINILANINKLKTTIKNNNENSINENAINENVTP